MFRLMEVGRLRRRTLLVAAATLAVVIGTGGGFLLLTAGFLQAQTPYFRITDTVSSSNVIGSGLDLRDIPTSNMLQDSSFEPLVFHQQLTALGGDAQTLYVSSEEAESDLYGEGFFNGAFVRVVSPADQEMTVRKSATVSSYVVNRIGGFQPVRLPDDLPYGLAFLSFTQRNDLIVAAGERGTLLVGLNTQTPVSVKTGVDSDLTGICTDAEGSFLACSRDGDILYSSDPVNWTAWAVPDGLSLNAVTASDKGFVAVGQDGAILIGSEGSMSITRADTSAHLYDVIYGDGRFLACGADGTVLLSSNGIVWKALSLDIEADWTCADYRDGLFVLAGTAGQVCLIDSDGQASPSVLPAITNIADVVFLSRMQLIVLDDQGQFYVSNDGGAVWSVTELDPGMHSSRIAATSQDRIVSAADDGSLGTSLLVNAIRLDTPLIEGIFQAGDLVFLENVTQLMPDSYLTGEAADIEDAWDMSRADAGARMNGLAAPGGGTGCMMLTVTPEAEQKGEAAFLSQILVSESGNTRFEQGRLYTVEFWMRQENLGSREVKVWLTGRFENVGTVIENVGNTWKKYNFTFLLPANAANAKPGEIRLNIGIEGQGTAWVDAVWLGRTEDRAGQPDADFTKRILDISPSVLRLSFLGIGDAGTRSQSWALGFGNESATVTEGSRVNVSCASLDTALQLSAAAGSLPWLTIGPYASDGEIRNLMEYLAGPLTESYGKIRMENGSPLPWTEVFSRFYIEIRDPENIMVTDARRASYVNHVIDIVRQSAYYSAIRNKITFIDGMSYDAALMLSAADYHASPLDVPLDTGMDTVPAVLAAYRVFYDASPRIMDRPTDVSYEMVRSATIRFGESGQSNLAACMEVMAFGAREGYSVILFAEPPSQGTAAVLPHEEAGRMLSALYLRGTPINVDVLEAAPGSLTAYAFRYGKSVSILLLNHADRAFSFPLDSRIPLDKAPIMVYDDTGRLVSDKILRRSSATIDVLAGGITVLTVQEDDTADR